MHTAYSTYINYVNTIYKYAALQHCGRMTGQISQQAADARPLVSRTKAVSCFMLIGNT